MSVDLILRILYGAYDTVNHSETRIIIKIFQTSDLFVSVESIINQGLGFSFLP